ncbi:MAG: hypothetical protein WC696_00375 [Candidatus Methylopumilus sp.]|jgi:hypothetical protein
MHSKISRLITIFVIILCLPLQGLAAIAMPACQVHGQKMDIHVDSDQMTSMAHCDHSSKHQHDGSHSDKKAPCNKCFSCYLSGTQAITPYIFSMELISSHALYFRMTYDIPDSTLTSVYRPPRLTMA